MVPFGACRYHVAMLCYQSSNRWQATLLATLLTAFGGCQSQRHSRVEGQFSNSPDQSRLLAEPLRASEGHPGGLALAPTPPIGFGYKASWIAVRSGSREDVASAVPLSEIQASQWDAGLDAACGRTSAKSPPAFVTPPIDGWVLVVSVSLPEPWDRAAFERLMIRLSARFGVAQYFASYRTVDAHAWSLFKNGEEIRTFAWSPESDPVCIRRGNVTPEERTLSLDYLQPENEGRFDEEIYPDGLRAPNEEDVMNVAALWSINPITIESINLPPSLGLLGILPPR